MSERLTGQNEIPQGVHFVRQMQTTREQRPEIRRSAKWNDRACRMLHWGPKEQSRSATEYKNMWNKDDCYILKPDPNTFMINWCLHRGDYLWGTNFAKSDNTSTQWTALAQREGAGDRLVSGGNWFDSFFLFFFSFFNSLWLSALSCDCAPHN